MIAVDCETTGSDHYHGARPFLVTICTDNDENQWWEWSVDPLTRKPNIPQEDIESLTVLLQNPTEEFVLHNARFDCSTLNMILSLPQEMQGWPWDRTEDTLVAGHVLASAMPHNLTDMAVQYLGYRKMEDYEKMVEAACKKARDYCRRFLPKWRIAKAGLPDMPSCKKSQGKDKNGQAKDSAWKNDMWLLKAITDHWYHPKDQRDKIKQFKEEWAGETGDGLCAEYANLDSAVTRRLWPVLKSELHRRGLWEIYRERMRLLPIAFRMERSGLTISETRLTELVARFAKGVEDATEVCLRIANGMGYPLTMPKGSANNDSLKKFFFGEATVSCSICKKKITANIGNRAWARSQKGRTGTCTFCKQRSSAVVREWPWLDLPILKLTESGQPALDKDTFEQYKAEELSDDQRQFLEALVSIRGQGKAVEALQGYQSFWLPLPGVVRRNPRGETEQLWKLIHPNLNQTGTDTLRWSSKNPNLQNISKNKEFNLRGVFGPAPGREHWSLDYRNIEKRIPTYESGEEALIDLFERADEPPFFGSYHILTFSVVYPDLWEKALKEYGPQHAAEWIKSPEGYKATNYQWMKNTNFGLQYECGDAKADKTAHAKGVKKMLAGSFPKEEAMKRYWINYANKHGYVETMPRYSVNPKKGYPLMCKRTDRGSVLTTVPLAYHVSGTAMDLTAAAMIACQEQLDVWNRECGIPENYRMCLQVHDELFFDFPQAADPKKNPRRSNLARIRIIQRIMESCGNDLVCRRLDGKTVTIPTPVSVEYHPVSWDKGVAI